MADTGKTLLPEFKKSIKISKDIKMLKYFGQAQESHIITFKQKQLGCHIITVPPSIIEKIEKFGKGFHQLQQKPSKVFLKDTKKSKFQNLIYQSFGCGGRI